MTRKRLRFSKHASDVDAGLSVAVGRKTRPSNIIKRQKMLEDISAVHTNHQLGRKSIPGNVIPLPRKIEELIVRFPNAGAWGPLLSPQFAYLCAMHVIRCGYIVLGGPKKMMVAMKSNSHFLTNGNRCRVFITRLEPNLMLLLARKIIFGYLARNRPKTTSKHEWGVRALSVHWGC